MAGKPYVEYHDDYRREMDKLVDSLSWARANVWIKEAAAADQTQEWPLLARHIDISVRFYELRNGKYAGATKEQSQAFVNDLLVIARDAEHEGFRHIKLVVLYDIADVYRFHIFDYRLAFEYYLQIAAELDNISTCNFPPRPWMYSALARLYYDFDDYANAILYYTKVINDPDAADNYYSSRSLVYLGLGLCYRNGYGDYGKSDEYFRTIYTLPEATQNVWGGITDGALGCNKYLQNAIRNCTGMTFTEYINSLRLQHACLLLGNRANRDTIDAIAAACGFSNRITLYRLFIRKYGISPDGFRKNVQLFSRICNIFLNLQPIFPGM